MPRVHIYYEVIYMHFWHLQYLVRFYCIIFIYLQNSPYFAKVYPYLLSCFSHCYIKKYAYICMGFSHEWNCVFHPPCLWKSGGFTIFVWQLWTLSFFIYNTNLFHSVVRLSEYKTTFIVLLVTVVAATPPVAKSEGFLYICNKTECYERRL